MGEGRGVQVKEGPKSRTLAHPTVEQAFSKPPPGVVATAADLGDLTVSFGQTLPKFVGYSAARREAATKRGRRSFVGGEEGPVCGGVAFERSRQVADVGRDSARPSGRRTDEQELVHGSLQV
jgi:hypothetical protein